MTAFGIKNIQIEFCRQIPEQAHALIVEFDAFLGKVIRAHDRRIAPGIAATDITLIDNGDVRDAVVTREVVGGGKTMTTGADDHDIVVAFQIGGRIEKAWFGVILNIRILQQA